MFGWSKRNMTIIELFPRLLAFCVAALTGTLLSRGGHYGAWVWTIAVVAGVASFAVYWLALKLLASWAERRTARKEKGKESIANITTWIWLSLIRFEAASFTSAASAETSFRTQRRKALAADAEISWLMPSPSVRKFETERK